MKNISNYTPVGSIQNIKLGQSEGYRISKTRPCLVVDNDRKTITVYPLTNDDGKNRRDTEIPIPKGIGNLSKDSKLKMSQPITIDREKIENYIGELPEKYLTEVINYIENKGIIKKIKNSIKKRNNRFNSTILSPAA